MAMLWTPFQSYACKNIFLLDGQSNMFGRRGVINNNWTRYIPPKYRSQSSILRLNVALTWKVACEPLHRDMDKNKTCGVGPSMSFANYVLEKAFNIGVIGLVPCAFGGSLIADWRQGSPLYDRHLKRSKAALEDGGEIRGLLWYQGESDTKKQEDAELYKKRVEVFFNVVSTYLSLPEPSNYSGGIDIGHRSIF
ncbi:probable carbohydrate esterase At4g34215 [Olea europaea subsp. europaea]|uniref:Probable carbohydrate esterase At4g34215 n=1 Tax=Olea europaea subsp. europaea TaxID=158383 RepID=A0A8S0QA06_OLEEU|nr:probable carbohydrate esterase At4g34215 [Olea europaea subsp. europaea]